MSAEGFAVSDRAKLTYAFGHLVGSFGTDAHAADSGELGDTVMDEIGLVPDERAIVRVLAEHVAGNYRYTGEADDLIRRIERGEV